MCCSQADDHPRALHHFGCYRGGQRTLNGLGVLQAGSIALREIAKEEAELADQLLRRRSPRGPLPTGARYASLAGFALTGIPSRHRGRAHDMATGEPVGRPKVYGSRVWAGGIATAVVAALIIVAGVYIARDILNIPVLAPKAAGSLGNSTTAVYAVVAAGGALLATALLHVLLLGAPRPLRFFTWIAGLAVVLAVVVPFSEQAELQSKVATAVINLVAGVAVISLLTGTGHAALQRPPAEGAGSADSPSDRDLYG
jgi:uncharacterized protein YhhL (DUF1145 family)